jgi:ribosomal protein S18 acetylase RimI-like enzyme
MLIRQAGAADRKAIWSILEPVFRAGETYAIDPAISMEDALVYWMSSDKQVFVAEEEGQILGTYNLRANQAGPGSHVCNCGYIVAAAAGGRGVARRMCMDSLERARRSGYRAMQFNFVVSTNERAVALWLGMGFEIVGRLPGAFDHPMHGDVDALVMFRKL